MLSPRDFPRFLLEDQHVLLSICPDIDRLQQREQVLTVTSCVHLSHFVTRQFKLCVPITGISTILIRSAPRLVEDQEFHSFPPQAGMICGLGTPTFQEPCNSRATRALHSRQILTERTQELECFQQNPQSGRRERLDLRHRP